MNEREIIALLAGLTGNGSSELLRGIGDDCAVIERDSTTCWLVTMDTLIESVHFDMQWHSLHTIGRKAVSVNVSDIGAMGGRPSYIFLSLGLPSGYSEAKLRQLAAGITAACAEYGCTLAGGDTVRSPLGLSLTITAIGTMRKDDVLYRNTARPGDEIWVSGVLGSAAAGLGLCRQGISEDERFHAIIRAHLDPRAQVELGAQLAESGLVHAMLDLSDGLATDLAHICRLSETGAVLDGASLPRDERLPDAASLLQADMYDLMVSGGEDYQLVFTSPAGNAQALTSLALGLGLRISRIGMIDTGRGVRLLKTPAQNMAAEEVDISYAGFDHFSTKRSPGE